MVAELAYAHDSKSCSCIRIVGSIPTHGTITETPHGRSRATGDYAMIMSKNYFQPSSTAPRCGVAVDVIFCGTKSSAFQKFNYFLIAHLRKILVKLAYRVEIFRNPT